MKTITLLNLMMCIIIILILSNCSYVMSLSTVKEDMDKDWYKEKIQPTREVKILILANEPDLKLEETIKEASDDMIKQVGISLNIIGYAPITKKFVGSTKSALQTLYTASEDPKVNYDIAITTWGVMGMDAMAPLGFFMLGVIDDTYRRYIVIRIRSKFILLHELYHAFIFKEAHGQCVMMSGLWPIGSSCIWLEQKNWDEVIENKWRTFGEIPDIPSKNRPDVIIPKGGLEKSIQDSEKRAAEKLDKLYKEKPILKDWRMPWQFDSDWEEGRPLPKSYIDQVNNWQKTLEVTNPDLIKLK